MPDKQEKLAEKADEAVVEARTATDIIDGEPEFNDGGFRQVDGHGWTKDELAERKEALEREKEEAKLFAETNEAERKRLNLPEPREQTKEEKKAEELTRAADAAVAAAGSSGGMVTGVLTSTPSAAETKKQREGTANTRASHTPVQGANDKHVPQDPSTKVLLHPDTPQVGPSDPPRAIQDRTGSLSNLLPRGQAHETSEDTGPTMEDLAAHPVKNPEADPAAIQDTNPQPEILKDVQDLEFPAVVVAPDEPTAEDSSRPPSKEKKAPASRARSTSASKPAPKAPEMTTGVQTATQTTTTERTSANQQKKSN